MTRAMRVLELLAPLCEVKSVTLSKDVKGLTFVNRRSVTVPAGEYTSLGPDEEMKGGVVISNDDTGDLFVVKAKDLK